MNPQAIEHLSWWQVGAVALSIPVTLLAIVYTWVLIRKTSLESRKLSLEILEKEADAFPAIASKPAEAKGEVALSKVQLTLFVAYLVFNIAIIFVNGLKARPLYGIEVLEIVLGATFFTLALGALYVLRMIGVARNLMSIDRELLGGIASIVASLKGKQRDLGEQ